MKDVYFVTKPYAQKLLLVAFGIGNLSIIFPDSLYMQNFLKVKLKTKKIRPPTTIHTTTSFL